MRYAPIGVSDILALNLDEKLERRCIIALKAVNRRTIDNELIESLAPEIVEVFRACGAFPNEGAKS